ncbi:MAG: hypothetical protein ACMUHY_07870 [Thermoplasmatota archaeon]
MAGMKMVKVDEEVISTIKLDEITADIVKAYLQYSRDIVLNILEKQSYNTPFKDLNDSIVIKPDELIELIDSVQSALLSAKD